MSRAPIISTTALRMLAVTALSFSMLGACAKTEEAAQEAATEAAIESMTDAEVDVEDGGQTVTGVDEQGRAFAVSHGDAAALPAGFPEDVRVPEGLVFETAMEVGGNMVVGGALPAELAAVAADIDAHMKGEGWTSTIAMIEPATATQVWQDGNRSVSYMLEARPEGGVGVVISYAVEATEAAPDATAP